MRIYIYINKYYIQLSSRDLHCEEVDGAVVGVANTRGGHRQKGEAGGARAVERIRRGRIPQGGRLEQKQKSAGAVRLRALPPILL